MHRTRFRHHFPILERYGGPGVTTQTSDWVARWEAPIETSNTACCAHQPWFYRRRSESVRIGSGILLVFVVTGVVLLLSIAGGVDYFKGGLMALVASR